MGWFGAEEGLGDSLRFPVFMSSLTPDAVKALKATHRKLPKKLNAFIREHDASLPSEVADDWRYDFRVLLLPQTGPKSESDAVIRFVREDKMTDEQRRARDVVQTIVRNKPVAVQNKGRHKPGTVAKLVSQRLGVKFSAFGQHVSVWRHYAVRPGARAARPELTDDRYCVYDEPHGDYLYTDTWVNRTAWQGQAAETLQVGEDLGRASSILAHAPDREEFWQRIERAEVEERTDRLRHPRGRPSEPL